MLLAMDAYFFKVFFSFYANVQKCSRYLLKLGLLLKNEMQKWRKHNEYSKKQKPKSI